MKTLLHAEKKRNLIQNSRLSNISKWGSDVYSNSRDQGIECIYETTGPEMQINHRAKKLNHYGFSNNKVLKLKMN